MRVMAVMRELSLLVSVVLCLPTLARAQTKETIIPAGSLLECTLEEPNFSSASAEVGDPVICHTRGVQEFGRAVFARGAYLAGHLAESNCPLFSCCARNSAGTAPSIKATTINVANSRFMILPLLGLLLGY